MKLGYFDSKGKRDTAGIEVSDSIFGVKPNMELIAQYVYVYLSNQREGNAKAKDRSEVSGGGKKPWKQKGTGRARSGSNRSPIWRGGGITFGPTGEQNYKKRMPVKMKRGAIKSALSLKAKDDKVMVIKSFDPKKTSEAGKLIDNMNIGKKVLIVHDDAAIWQNLRNLSNVKVTPVKELNAYDVYTAQNMIIVENALEFLNTTLNK